MSLQVSALWIYPVKSLPGVSLESLSFDALGPKDDRRYMLIGDNGRFITQRQHPALTLLTLRAEGEGWRIALPDASSQLFIPREGSTHVEVKTTIWQDEVMLYDQGSVAADFFSSYLQKPVRLVYQADNCKRLIDPNFNPGQRIVSLSDGFPILLANEASLAFINKKSGLDLDMPRFRPNLVVRGAEPFAENQWKNLEIASNVFDLVKPCSRCVIPTIDRNTAKKQPDVWQALKAVCQGEDGKIYFGQNLIHQNLCSVSKHDAVIAVLS